jgi:hypothetical protein
MGPSGHHKFRKSFGMPTNEESCSIADRRNAREFSRVKIGQDSRRQPQDTDLGTIPPKLREAIRKACAEKYCGNMRRHTLTAGILPVSTYIA